MTKTLSTANWQTINTSDLAAVTGGKSTGLDASTTASLAAIQDGIKGLAADTGKKKSGFDDPMTMCLFALCMSKQNQAPSNTTVIAGGGAPVSAGWSFHSRTSVRW